jgi:arylsulfatase A-like enzyme
VRACVTLALWTSSPAAAVPPGDVALRPLADQVATAFGIVPPLVTVDQISRPGLPAIPTLVAHSPTVPTARRTPEGDLEISARCSDALRGMRVAAFVLTPADVQVERFRCPDADEPIPLRLRGVSEDPSRVIVLVQPLAPYRVKTPAVTLRPGTSLRASTALLQTGPLDRSGHPRARIVARNAAGRTATVLDRRFDWAATPADRHWVDVRVDLDPIRAALGPEVRLSFESDADQRAPYPVHPVWGDPVLASPIEDATAKRWNVLLVSLDTLRADRVGSYGWPRKGTPVLDRLASEGTRFDTVIAQAPWTLPSHATMLTGFYPCVHGLTGSLGHPLPAGIVPLAEHLRAAGYATAATPEDIFFDPAAFARGFGFYHENHSNAPIRMPVTVGFAVDWLRTHATTPFFLLVHTYQAHEPYFAPPEVRAAFGAPAQTVGTDAPRAQQAAQYDAAVAYTDTSLAPLLDALDESGVRDRTIVVVASDHGEALQEHGYTGHGRTLHEEVLRVPMIWRAPGLIGAGRHVTGQVGLIDLTPTLLDLLGLPAGAELQGRSLVPLLRPGGPTTAPADRVLFSENSLEFYRRAARWNDWKATFEHGGVEIVDLLRDPGEMSPGAPPDRVAEATRAGANFDHECARARAAVEQAGAGVPTGPVVPPDEATLRRLRALGYVH